MFWDWSRTSEFFSELETEVDESLDQNIEDNLPSDSDSDPGPQSPTNHQQISPSLIPHTPSEPVTTDDDEHVHNTEILQPVSPSQESNSSVASRSLMPPRRSTRVPKPALPRSACQPKPDALYVGGEVSIPQTYKEAIHCTNSAKWKSAIDEKLSSINQKGGFSHVTHVPHGRIPIGSRWVFIVKSDGRFKARLVAQGFSQAHGIEYFDTYSPTLRMDSLRILLAVAAFFGWEIHQIDVRTAYLEGDFTDEIYMQTPEGVEGTKYVRLNKALYGLKQAGKAWYDKLDGKFMALSFN
ncbi:hypothetical protein K3495_g13242 [Podosphaera aphanis]|nr:hypothetical protein K3495_g13242 [Podosphaera aphanis]